MKKIFILLLMIIPFVVFSNGKSTHNLSGKYQCSFYDFETKTNYVEIGKLVKTGETYSFTRTNAKEGTFHATGLKKGHTLSFVFWGERKYKDTKGVLMYRIAKNGDLYGLWTTANSQTVGKDFCKKI